MNTYEINNDYVKVNVINTKNEGFFLIDKEDLDVIKKHSWYIKDSSDNKGYVSAKINGKTVKLHRYILNVTDRKMIVDHIDRDKMNNRKNNLRIVTSTVNNTNASFSKNNTSGRTGVKYVNLKGKSPRWDANVTVNGKRLTKSFSISKYGDEAFNLAVKQREQWEIEYNITTEKERSETIETTIHRV